MRIGFNPNKDKVLPKSEYYHQVVIPLHIPHQDGYFKDSFEIFKLSISSLFKTCHKHTYFTVVNNGSCDVVKLYLDDLYHQRKIHEVIHTSAIGKLNAVLKGIVGNNFHLITITDADVLFLNSWQKATYQVFEAFPQTGAVCTTPSSKVLKQHTSSVLWHNFFSSKIYFSKVLDPEALLKFSESIEKPDFYKKIHLEKYLTINNSKNSAVVGAGHFCATYNAHVFDTLNIKHTNSSLGGNSETVILDQPVNNQGYWRLSTENNFTYHLGNTFEDWMTETFDCVADESHLILKKPHLMKANQSKWFIFVKEKIFSKILFSNPVWNLFLRYKGLTKEEARVY